MQIYGNFTYLLTYYVAALGLAAVELEVNNSFVFVLSRRQPQPKENAVVKTRLITCLDADQNLPASRLYLRGAAALDALDR